MKKKLKKLIIIVAIIFLIILLCLKVNKVKNYNADKNEENMINALEDDNLKEIEGIKNEINATANSNMYQVEEEYDGRKIIQIKPDIQFDTVLAGILKETMPEEKEISKILNKCPTKNGVWVSKKSREKFLKILNNNEQYEIDNEGYLNIKKDNNDENTKKIKKVIESEKMYIIDISGTVFIRDEITGKIVEYPFERMSPEQVLEIYSNRDRVILEITTNSKEKLSNNEILQEILLNL